VWISNTYILWNLNTSNVATYILQAAKDSEFQMIERSTRQCVDKFSLVSCFVHEATWLSMFITWFSKQYGKIYNTKWETMWCSICDPKYWRMNHICISWFPNVPAYPWHEHLKDRKSSRIWLAWSWWEEHGASLLRNICDGMLASTLLIHGQCRCIQISISTSCPPAPSGRRRWSVISHTHLDI